jgi:predicted aldo/keto reductase-like oxidoreductase
MFGNFVQPSRSYSFQVNGKTDASRCAACGACEKKCPQGLGIIEGLKTAHEALKGWVE